MLSFYEWYCRKSCKVLDCREIFCVCRPHVIFKNRLKIGRDIDPGSWSVFYFLCRIGNEFLFIRKGLHLLKIFAVKLKPRNQWTDGLTNGCVGAFKNGLPFIENGFLFHLEKFQIWWEQIFIRLCSVQKFDRLHLLWNSIRLISLNQLE